MDVGWLLDFLWDVDEQTKNVKMRIHQIRAQARCTNASVIGPYPAAVAVTIIIIQWLIYCTLTLLIHPFY